MGSTGCGKIRRMKGTGFSVCVRARERNCRICKRKPKSVEEGPLGWGSLGFLWEPRIHGEERFSAPGKS